MRAFQPTEAGRLWIAGYPVDYETFGDRHAPPMLLLPAWQILNQRHWKMQVAWFAHSHYVITFDGARRTDDITVDDVAAFAYDCIVDQAVCLLDELQVVSAPVFGYSRGCAYAILMAARYPARVRSLVLITNGVQPDAWTSEPAGYHLQRESYEGWEKFNAHHIQQDYEGWMAFLFGEVFNEPFSSKAIEDATSWGREISPQLLAASEGDPALLPQMDVRTAIDSIGCPVLMIHGAEAQCTPVACTLALAGYRQDWSQVILEGSGQAPNVRDPVRVNLLIADFLRTGQPQGRFERQPSHGPLHESD